MGLHQAFRFKADSAESVRDFLRSLASNATLGDDRGDFFVFSNRATEPSFTFDCEIVSDGVVSERAGEYFPFLGVFVEALTGRFGAVTVEDL